MITLFVDASHCSQTLAAGWGAWAIADGWDHGRTFGGQHKRRVLNSGEAEVWAMAEAIHHMKTRGWLTDDALMIQSDSHRALQLFLVKFPNAEIKNHTDSKPFVRPSSLYPSPAESAAQEDMYRDLLTMKWLFVRHVKGHASGDGRNWVNRKCDEIAKQNMRRMRQSRGGYRH